MAQPRAAELKKALEQEIVTGKLKPGDRLDEMGVAARFNVSRTPVREALHQLASIGLVEIRPRRGAVVSSIGLKDLVEMFEVMAALEGMCGRLAARRMTEQERKELVRLHRKCQKSAEDEQHDAYYELNVQFHEALYNGSHNMYLAEQTRNLRNRLAPYRRLQLRQHNRVGQSFGEHEAIVQAIMNNDADGVDRLLQEHVTIQGGSFNDFISSLPSDLTQVAS